MIALFVGTSLDHASPCVERSTAGLAMGDLCFVRLAPATRAFAAAKIVAGYGRLLAAFAPAQPRCPRRIFVAAISPNNRQVSKHLPGHVFQLRVSSHVSSKFRGQG